MGLGFSEQNWNDCLESLGFTEQKNTSFGGMVILDDNGIPVWDYDNLERKELLYFSLLVPFMAECILIINEILLLRR